MRERERESRRERKGRAPYRFENVDTPTYAGGRTWTRVPMLVSSKCVIISCAPSHRGRPSSYSARARVIASQDVRISSAPDERSTSTQTALVRALHSADVWDISPGGEIITLDMFQNLS